MSFDNRIQPKARPKIIDDNRSLKDQIRPFAE
jgi:hypothetical protein